MLTRRILCAGAGAIAITTALPAAITAQGLTADERLILDALGAHATAAQRAWTLESYRQGSPKLRKACRLVAAMTPEQLQFLLVEIEHASPSVIAY